MNINFYEYVSENESVATVDDFGIITAIGAGEAVVRLKATVYDEGVEKVLEAMMKVLVTEPEPEKDSGVKPLWFILGGAALLLIAGAVVALVLRKKKNSKAST